MLLNTFLFIATGDLELPATYFWQWHNK